MKRKETEDIVLGNDDAGLLRTLLDTLEHLDRFDEAAEALDALLENAGRVGQAALPADRVALGLEVDYQQAAAPEPRTVMLVLPEQADPGQGRVSVLSPVGRALLGRKKGASVELRLPDGRTPKLKVLAVRRATTDRAAADQAGPAFHFSANAFSMT